MRRDFLIELLGRGARGELASAEQFRDELGMYVAALADQIQDAQTHFDNAAAGHLGLNLSDPYHRTQLFKADALIATARELTLQPLIEERDLCSQRLMIDYALKISRKNPSLASALFRLGVS